MSFEMPPNAPLRKVQCHVTLTGNYPDAGFAVLQVSFRREVHYLAQFEVFLLARSTCVGPALYVLEVQFVPGEQSVDLWLFPLTFLFAIPA